jgi:hypothetical protein
MGWRLIMLSGIYYPHTTADKVSALKTALLLCNEPRFIVPYTDFLFRSESNAPLVDEAYERMGSSHTPSDIEERLVHDQIEEWMFLPGSHEFLSASDETLPGRYEIYPQKLLHETWAILQQRGLTERSGRDEFLMGLGSFEDYVTSHKLGLMLMLYLAQACAGETRRLITDRTSAYNSLNQALAASVAEDSHASSEYDRIVTRSLKVVDPSRINLETLIALRRTEVGSQGHHLRKMRHSYLKMIDDFAAQLNQAAEVDIPEIERQQEQRMKDNLVELKDALKVAANDLLHEKELFIAMVAAAGMAVTPIAIPAGITSIIALNKTRLKYKQARRKAMTDHAMSWLLHASQQGHVTTY